MVEMTLRIHPKKRSALEIVGLPTITPLIALHENNQLEVQRLLEAVVFASEMPMIFSISYQDEAMVVSHVIITSIAHRVTPENSSDLKPPAGLQPNKLMPLLVALFNSKIALRDF